MTTTPPTIGGAVVIGFDPIVISVGGPGGGTITSIYGRVGAVTAQAGDYTAVQVGADPAGTGTAARAFAVQRANHTGTQSADTITDGLTNVAHLATERAKLAGIATGATVNSADVTLLARANHTGTQSADTLTDGTTNKAFLTTERTKLSGIATGATANSTDAFLLARANATGTESADVLTDGTTNKAYTASERTKLAAVTSDAVPAYAPTVLLNKWRSDLSSYNFNARTMHAVNAACTKLAGGTKSMHVGFIGDSTLIGYDGASYNYAQSIPYTFGKALAKRLGGVAVTTGIQAPTVATATVGDRWTTTAGFTTGLASSVQLLTASGAGTASWVSPDACTDIDFFVSNLSTTGQLKWQVDGGALSSFITTTGAGTVQKVTISGLSNAVHTLKLTSASGSTFILGARPYVSGTVQLHVHNLAIGGAKANTSGTAGLNYSDVTTAGLGNSTQLLYGASGVTFDLLVISAGNNDAFAGTTGSTIVTGLTTMRGYFAGIPTVFIHPPSVTGTNGALFTDFCTRIFTMVDSLDAPFFDWNDKDQGVATYTSDGLPGADGIHPAAPEQATLGNHLAGLVQPFTR